MLLIQQPTLAQQLSNLIRRRPARPFQRAPERQMLRTRQLVPENILLGYDTQISSRRSRHSIKVIDLSLGRALQTRDNPQQRSLPASISPAKDVNPSRRDVQVEMIDRSMMPLLEYTICICLV